MNAGALTLLAEDVEPLRSYFNAKADRARLIALISPT
jgi:hypothetical protein